MYATSNVDSSTMFLVQVLILGVDSTRQNQISHGTSEDRYPHVYAAVHRLSRATFAYASPKILNFGSSTGQEALTLARKYFHRSAIVGVDVDELTLSAARHTCANVSARVFMFNAKDMPLDLLGTYDVIFANSVLCRHPWDFHRNSSEWYPFSLFEETIVALNDVLHVGGILCIINPNYRLEDTSLAHAYQSASVANCGNYVPLFSSNGRRLPVRDVCVYTKQQR